MAFKPREGVDTNLVPDALTSATALRSPCVFVQRKTPRSAMRRGGQGGGAGGGRRKISFAEAPDEGNEDGQDDEEVEPEDEDPIEDPDLVAPTSSAEVTVRPSAALNPCKHQDLRPHVRLRPSCGIAHVLPGCGACQLPCGPRLRARHASRLLLPTVPCTTVHVSSPCRGGCHRRRLRRQSDPTAAAGGQAADAERHWRPHPAASAAAPRR